MKTDKLGLLLFSSQHHHCHHHDYHHQKQLDNFISVSFQNRLRSINNSSLEHVSYVWRCLVSFSCDNNCTWCFLLSCMQKNAKTADHKMIQHGVNMCYGYHESDWLLVIFDIDLWSIQGQLSLPSLQVDKWVPASAGKAKAGMLHSVSRCMRGVQVKLWDPLRTRAIPKRLRGVITTRCNTNPRLPYLTLRAIFVLWG